MRLPSHAGRALASATLLSGFLALLYALDRRELDPSVLRLSLAPMPVVFAVVSLAAFGCALAPARSRRAILVGAAVVAAPLVLGAWSIAWLAYVGGVIAVARAPLPIAVKLAVSVIAWAVVPIARDVWLDGEGQAETIVLAIVWAGQLYSAIYLIVEREREAPEARPTVLADAFYLVALPRLVVPFFQPISPRRLARCERADMSRASLGRAAGLAAYAAGVAALAWSLDGVAHAIEYRPLALAVRFCRFYAHATYTIFTAIAMFRLLGFDLPSGFRAPFLSRSFAEFFRRFNHYVRDAVLSLFYFPLLGLLRHRLGARAASIVSAYAAIALGSFLFHDLLVPLSIAIEPGSVVGHYLDPVRVVGLVALWTLIIVPNAGIAPRRPPPRSRMRTVLEIAWFNAVYFVVWYAQEVGRGPG